MNEWPGQISSILKELLLGLQKEAILWQKCQVLPQGSRQVFSLVYWVLHWEYIQLINISF